MKRKKPELRGAVTGRLSEAQRWILADMLKQYEEIERAVRRVAQKISQEVENSADPYVAEAVRLLDSIPGIAERVAQIIVSEIGVEMSRFPTEKQLSSWGGKCRGNNE